MADKGGKGSDKLSEALRRAEEAVLKEERQLEEGLKKKELDLDEVVPKDAPKRKMIKEEINLPKQQSGPQMVDLPKQEKPKAKPQPKPAPKPSKAGQLPASLSFGMLDLGGGSAEGQELELATTEEKPARQPGLRKQAPKPQAPAPSKPAPEPPPAEPPEDLPTEPEPFSRREESRYDPVMPIRRRSYGREIKIAVIVLLILGAIGGGVFGFLKWRESVAAEKAALKEQINSSSLESLRDDKIKKEKFK